MKRALNLFWKAIYYATPLYSFINTVALHMAIRYEKGVHDFYGEV